MSDIEKLTELFKEFPGIGPRQAKRFVYFLLRKNQNYINDLVRLIPEIKKSIKNCQSCFRYFSNSQSNQCDICLNKNRDPKKILIVARDSDFEAIEKSDSYDGYYFILGGTVPHLEEEYQKFIRLNELKKIIQNRIKEGLEEIIIALNINPESENTVNIIKNNSEIDGLKVTILGRGLSTGSELEYADRETIVNALKNRN